MIIVPSDIVEYFVVKLYSFIAENEMKRLFVTGSTSLLLRLRLRKTDSGNDTNWIKYSHYIQSPERNKKLGDELNVV